MPRLARRRPGHTAAVGLAAAVLVIAPTLPAAAAPTAPSFAPSIEALAAYDPQRTCSSTAKPGATALRSLVMAAYAGTGDFGIVRDCAVGGTSEHKEGRAWDWKVNAFNASQDAAAKDFFTWLLATDGHGNSYALARRLGVMYMIYNRHIWSAYNADAGWRPYTGANPHTDHVHISLSWPGADKHTSYWAGTSATPSPSPSPSPSTAPATDLISSLWASMGGATGPLGRAVGDPYAVDGGRAQNYEKGRIYSAATTGTHAVWGAIGGKHLALGGAVGPLGLPTSAESDVPGGRTMTFQGGRVYWSAATGAHTVWGAVLGEYLATEGPAGPLGLPITDEVPVKGGLVAGFQGGQVYWSSSTGAHALWGGIGEKYLARGAAEGPLGLPTSGEKAVKDGRAVTFQGGGVYWSQAGTAAVWGGIAGKYTKLGGPDGPLGLPTADEAPVRGGVGTTFTGGRVYWSAGTGAHAVWGGIAGKYLELAGPEGPLGLPTSDEGDVKGGRTSTFQGGRVYWSPTTGAHAVWGAIAGRYLELGGSDKVGFPVSDEAGAGPGRVTRFEAGSIYWSDATGARFLYGAVLGRYAAADPAVVGLPTDEEAAAGSSGRMVTLQRGVVLWSSETGARLVHGTVLAHHTARGGVSGFLGLPVSELEQVTPSVQRQIFQGGHVHVSANGTKHVLGAILGQYLALGGAAGRLGAPTSDEYSVPGGRRSDFVGGSITWTATTGRLTVT